jgi:hypothetical protein
MIRQHHRTASLTALALALALAASVAPAASADPQPLAQAEAAIAANRSPASPIIRPNPDNQTVTRESTTTGPCSDTCSGRGYGYVTQPSQALSEAGVTLPHDSRPRPLALPSLYGPTSTRTAVVRVVSRSEGFHWGDAGVGAGGMLALTLIALGGAATTMHRRNHRIHEQHAS